MCLFNKKAKNKFAKNLHFYEWTRFACCALATAKRVLRHYVFRIERISFFCISFVILWHLTRNVKQKLRFSRIETKTQTNYQLNDWNSHWFLVVARIEFAWNRNGNGQNERVLILMRMNLRVFWPQQIEANRQEELRRRATHLQTILPWWRILFKIYRNPYFFDGPEMIPLNGIFNRHRAQSTITILDAAYDRSIYNETSHRKHNCYDSLESNSNESHQLNISLGSHRIPNIERCDFWPYGDRQ